MSLELVELLWLCLSFAFFFLYSQWYLQFYHLFGNINQNFLQKFSLNLISFSNVSHRKSLTSLWFWNKLRNKQNCLFYAVLIIGVIRYFFFKLILILKFIELFCSIWYNITFYLILKPHARVSSHDTFVAKRFSGPSLASEYFYQVNWLNIYFGTCIPHVLFYLDSYWTSSCRIRISTWNWCSRCIH